VGDRVLGGSEGEGDTFIVVGGNEMGGGNEGDIVDVVTISLLTS